MTRFRTEEIKESALQVLTELCLPEHTQSRCLNILDNGRTKEILSRQKARGIIAGTIYIAAILTENRLTQQGIAGVMNISEATIRKYYAMLVDELKIQKNKA